MSSNEENKDKPIFYYHKSPGGYSVWAAHSKYRVSSKALMLAKSNAIETYNKSRRALGLDKVKSEDFIFIDKDEGKYKDLEKLIYDRWSKTWKHW